MKPNSDVVVGICGLGIMGRAYAGNLMAAGFAVAGYDPDGDAMNAFEAAGGACAGSPADLARRSDVVITAIATSAILLDVYLGKSGLIGSLRPGRVAIETSTLPIEVKETCRAGLAGGDVIVLDAPVSGTGAQAAAKDLLVYASGDKAAVDATRPVFDGFARETMYVGPFGTGMKMKYVANHLVTIHNLAAAEAILLGRRSGLDPNLVYDAIRKGAGTSRMFEVRGPMMVKEQYEPATMKFDVFQKDIGLIVEFARRHAVPTPLLDASVPLYAAAIAQGRGKQDTAGLHAVLKQLARPSGEGRETS